MRYPGSEKLEIICLVKQSHLPGRRMLEKLGVSRATKPVNLVNHRVRESRGRRQWRLRREPKLPDHVAIVKETANLPAHEEFAVVDDEPEETVHQARVFRRQMRGLARQASLDPAGGLELWGMADARLDERLFPARAVEADRGSCRPHGACRARPAARPPSPPSCRRPATIGARSPSLAVPTDCPINLSAACLFRLVWISTSSTSLSASTARHR